MSLYDDIKDYVPFNEQEEKDKELILKSFELQDDIFTRDNTICHLTASSWIVNKDYTKVLMIYHNIYDSWSWLGGHADGQKDMLEVALKEAKEESGIVDIAPVSDKIFSLEVLTVDGHIKRGQYVSSHLHLNVTYLLMGDDSNELTIKEDENSGVKWFPIEEVVAASNEKWFRDHIYSKLNEKLEKGNFR